MHHDAIIIELLSFCYEDFIDLIGLQERRMEYGIHFRKSKETVASIECAPRTCIYLTKAYFQYNMYTMLCGQKIIIFQFLLWNFSL